MHTRNAFVAYLESKGIRDRKAASEWDQGRRLLGDCAMSWILVLVVSRPIGIQRGYKAQRLWRQKVMFV